MKFKVRDGYTVRSVAGQWVAMSTMDKKVNASDLVVLSDTGVFLWNTLAEGISKEDLIIKVTDEYEVDAKTAADDIDRFLDKLKASNLLEE